MYLLLSTIGCRCSLPLPSQVHLRTDMRSITMLARYVDLDKRKPLTLDLMVRVELFLENCSKRAVGCEGVTRGVTDRSKMPAGWMGDC